MLRPGTLPDAAPLNSASVILLHGLGDQGNSWEPVASQMSMPWVKYIFPSAAARPVTINMGMSMPAWADIKGLSADVQEDEEVKVLAFCFESGIHNEASQFDRVQQGQEHSERVLWDGECESGAFVQICLSVSIESTLIIPYCTIESCLAWCC